jgi:hypothetical protein
MDALTPQKNAGPLSLCIGKVVEMKATRRKERSTSKRLGENVILRTGSDVISRGKEKSEIGKAEN